MIVIFSRADDGTTGFVAEWLRSLNKDYIILNTDDECTKFLYSDLNKQEIFVKKNNTVFDLGKAHSIWVRRNGISASTFILPKKKSEIVFFDQTNFIKNHLTDETRQWMEYVHFVVDKKARKKIGSFEFGSVNKLIVLEHAKSCGMNIGNTLIISQKDTLGELLQKEIVIITKPLGQGVYRLNKDIGYYTYVNEINSNNMDEIPETFFPSCIQYKVEKKYELRIFFLNGKCYSMAIFSQEESSTSVDFRSPNSGKPLRHVPYNLPEKEVNKIRELMSILNLNTGSIDMIVDIYGNYIFLEVNPVGQFSMTSYPCNYYLEKKIAEYL